MAGMGRQVRLSGFSSRSEFLSVATETKEIFSVFFGESHEFQDRVGGFLRQGQLRNIVYILGISGLLVRRLYTPQIVRVLLPKWYPQ